MHRYHKHKHAGLRLIIALTVAGALAACGGGDPSAESKHSAPMAQQAETASGAGSGTTLNMSEFDQASTVDRISADDQTSNDSLDFSRGSKAQRAMVQDGTTYCGDGNYPAQWEWDPNDNILNRAAAATSGTPKIEQWRGDKLIATYTKLGGDPLEGDGYSKQDSTNGEDTSVGPFRRKPYRQWQSGDTFLIYPAVYSARDMQIFLGPMAANYAASEAGQYVVPENITIRGVTVDKRRPVIVNPSQGAADANFNQALIYVHGAFDKDGKLVKPAKNITIENLIISDSSKGGFIGKAAVYLNGVENFTLREVRILGFKQHSANGVFATSSNKGKLLLQNVELAGNGGPNGPEHNAYINGSDYDPNFTFHVRTSWSHGSYYGHALKSRAQRTIVESSYLAGERAAPGKQTETYLLDVPNGGVLIARNNIFVKNYSGNFSNGASLTFGVEGIKDGRTSDLTVEHNTFVAFSRYYDDQQHQLFPMFIGSNVPGSKNVSNNAFVGYCPTGNQNDSRDFRGTNFATLNFNEIDMTFRPIAPSLTGNPNIKGTGSYTHKMFTVKRETNALGARDPKPASTQTATLTQ